MYLYRTEKDHAPNSNRQRTRRLSDNNTGKSERNFGKSYHLQGQSDTLNQLAVNIKREISRQHGE